MFIQKQKKKAVDLFILFFGTKLIKKVDNLLIYEIIF